MVRLDLAGPARLRQAFLPTNLGNLMAGTESKLVWKTLDDRLQALWDASAKQDGGEIWGEGKAGEAEREEVYAGDGLCFAVRLKSHAPFAVSFQKWVSSEGRVGDDHKAHGATVHSQHMVGDTTVYYTVIPDLMLFAMGERGRNQEPEFPAVIRRIKKSAPPGLNGMGMLDIQMLTHRDIQSGVRVILREFLRELPPFLRGGLQAPELQAHLEAMIPLLTKYNLDKIAVLTGYEDDSFRLRVVW